MIYVLRRDHDGLRRYAHIERYAHIGRAITTLARPAISGCSPAIPEIGEDLTELFNFLTSSQAIEGSYLSAFILNWMRLLPAPRVLKQALIDKIEREISRHREGYHPRAVPGIAVPVSR